MPAVRADPAATVARPSRAARASAARANRRARAARATARSTQAFTASAGAPVGDVYDRPTRRSGERLLGNHLDRSSVAFHDFGIYRCIGPAGVCIGPARLAALSAKSIEPASNNIASRITRICHMVAFTAQSPTASFDGCCVAWSTGKKFSARMQIVTEPLFIREMQRAHVRRVFECDIDVANRRAGR